MRRSSSIGFQAVDDAKRSQVTLRQDAMRETHLKVTGLAAERKKFHEIEKGKRATYQQMATSTLSDSLSSVYQTHSLEAAHTDEVAPPG